MNDEGAGAASDLLKNQNPEAAQKLQWLQNAWQEGLESGDFRPLDLETIKADGRRRLALEG